MSFSGGQSECSGCGFDTMSCARLSLLTNVTREPIATVIAFGDATPAALMVIVVPPLGAGVGVGVGAGAGAGAGDGLGAGVGAGDGLGDGEVGELLPPPHAATVNASVIAAGLLYVVGNGPTGIVLRGVDLTKRQITVDTPLPSGADGLIQVRDRFLILNRMASPGLYWVRPDGSYDGALEETPVAEAWASGGRLVAALRDGGFPQRTVQVRDLSSGGVLWTAPAHGAVIGIDGDAVGHVETGGDEGTPVLRDAATGQLRWRGAPFAIDPSRIAFAGAHVFFGHMTGITVYRRADGTPAGEIVSGATAQLLGERLYLGGFKFLACVDPDRVRA